MKLHAACRLFPKLSDTELSDLAADIKANGLQNPIIRLDGKILDGRNRYAACKRAGVRPRFVEWDGKGSPIAWVISQNLVRRHLTASQRAIVALDLLPLLERDAKERQRKRNGKVAHNCATLNGKASEAAARLVKSSARYVEMAKTIAREAPELVPRIRSGELTVPDAEKQFRLQEAFKQSQRLRRRRRWAAIGKDDAERVICGDALDLIPLLNNRSVDLVVTSPPYAQQRQQQYRSVAESRYPEWTVKWMGLLREKLSDHGSVLIVIRPHIRRGLVSDYVMKTRLALRQAGWHECEELIWLKPDAPPLGSLKRPRRTWESILWFSKIREPYVNLTACGQKSDRLGFISSCRFGIGSKSPISNGQALTVKTGIARCPDVFVAPVSTVEKGIHHPAMFPESLAEQLIATFSQKGDLVADPFAGAGNTLTAAKKQGRDYWGCDVSKRYVSLAQKRLAGIQ